MQDRQNPKGRNGGGRERVIPSIHKKSQEIQQRQSRMDILPRRNPALHSLPPSRLAHLIQRRSQITLRLTQQIRHSNRQHRISHFRPPTRHHDLSSPYKQSTHGTCSRAYVLCGNADSGSASHRKYWCPRCRLSRAIIEGGRLIRGRSWILGWAGRRVSMS